MAHDYTKNGGDAPALTEPVALMLAQRLGRVEHIAPLAFVVGRLLKLQCQHETMPRILQAAANLSAKAGLAAQALDYRAQLHTRFPQSEEARQVAAYAPV